MTIVRGEEKDRVAMVIKEHVAESQMQLAEVIAKMTEGLLKTHGLFLPQGARRQLEAKAVLFLEETPGIKEQIEAQIRKSMTRPPAA